MFYFTNDENAAFFVQLKGENAGQPLKRKTPNSIGIVTDEKLLHSTYLYYVVLYLYMAGHFTPYLKGSVIPYIRHRDITLAIVHHFADRRKA